MKKTIITSFTLGLMACGGSEPEKVDADPVVMPTMIPPGIWQGSINNNGETFELIAFTSTSSEMRFISEDGELSKVNFTFDGFENLSGTLKAWDEDATYLGEADFNGSYTSSGITANISINGEVISSADFTFSPLTNDGASLEVISGNYVTDDFETSFVIDEDGSLSGSDTDGCQYSGTFTLEDPNINLYELTFDATSCGDFNGSYNGLAFSTPTFDDNGNLSDSRAIIFHIDNGTNAVAEFLFPN